MAREALAPRRIIVTGGAGFIGSNFVHWVVENQPEVNVTVLDALTYAGNRENLAGIPEDRLTFVHGDICDAALLEELVPETDAIVHFAAESHNDNSIADPAPFVRTNVEGTFQLLEAARRHGTRFHHISTDEVYGDLALDDPARFTEETPYRPSSPYSSTKASSDMLVRAWHRTYGVDATISNCSNNYGPYHFPEKLIPLIILNALAGKPLPVYGNGAQIRDWLYVEDHARALYRVVTEGAIGETYNIGGHNERKNIDVVKTVCTLLEELVPNKPEGVEHYADLITYVTDRPGHDMRYAIDAAKIERELGWRPQETFESGIRKTVQWYLANESWWKRVQDGSYAGERLGLQ